MMMNENIEWLRIGGVIVCSCCADASYVCSLRYESIYIQHVRNVWLNIPSIRHLIWDTIQRSITIHNLLSVTKTFFECILILKMMLQR